MQTNGRTLKLGTAVHYTPDPRVGGVVVGYGTVDNAHDNFATGDDVFHVVIVRLDQAVDLAPHSPSFHAPFDPSLLKETS
jgi:hypothetical protein